MRRLWRICGNQTMTNLHVIEKKMQKKSPSVSNGERPLCTMRFASDIDLLGDSEEELQELTDRLDKAAVGCGMEISSDKSKIYHLSTASSQCPPPIYG